MTAGRTDNIMMLAYIYQDKNVHLHPAAHASAAQARRRLSYRTSKPVKVPIRGLICFVGQKAVDHVHRNGVADGHVRSLDHAGQAAQQRPWTIVDHTECAEISSTSKASDMSVSGFLDSLK